METTSASWMGILLKYGVISDKEGTSASLSSLLKYGVISDKEGTSASLSWLL